jgi:CRISPR-associated protein Csm4
MKAYKLKFYSSFHLDSETAVDGLSEIFIKSDTLFSAICSAANKFYGNEIVEEFLFPGNVIVSSAFPFYKEELFFPKPMSYFPEIEDYEIIKEFKKIKFISQNYLNFIAQGNKIETSLLRKDFILNGCWMSKRVGNSDLIFKTYESPHIVLDRISNATQIFYKTEVYFSTQPQAGLYFIADVKDELVTKFETVLRFLGDEGIGADRTIGKGLFAVEEIRNFSLPTCEGTNFYYLLSMYSPNETEFNSILPKESFYDFEIRKGWITNNTLRRKALRMFREGSVIKVNSNIPLKGMIHKVLDRNEYSERLQTDIFRSGQVIAMPIKG